MAKNNKLYDINSYNIKFTKNNIRYLLGLIILLLLILLFIRSKIILFMIIFLMIIVLSKNLLISVIISIILFLLINLLIQYKNTLEDFQNNEEKETSDNNTENKKDKSSNVKDIAGGAPIIDKGIFENDDFKKASNGIKDLLKTVNGGIELKDDDLKETDKLNINTDKYSDDKKPNALKQAQKEAYELINTVNALKDTVSSLSPVLTEGKKLMDIFQNLKL